MTLIKKIPLPITGLILAMFVLGNLLQSDSQLAHDGLGILATLLLGVITLRISADRQQFKSELQQPVPASVFPTYSMSLMVFSTYIAAFHSQIALLVWIFGILLHLFLLLLFTKRWSFDFHIENVYPSWLIVYIGIVTASVTAPIHQQFLVGQLFFLLGASLIVAVLPLVLYRVYKVKKIPSVLRANITIICAPVSLLLAGYLNSFATPHKGVFFGLLLISQLLYFFILIQVPSFFTKAFLPSFSAFTFPTVITALSLKAAGKYLAAQNVSIPFFSVLLRFEMILAGLFITYVFLGYLVTGLILPLKSAWQEKSAMANDLMDEDHTS